MIQAYGVAARPGVCEIIHLLQGADNTVPQSQMSSRALPLSGVLRSFSASRRNRENSIAVGCSAFRPHPFKYRSR